MKEKVSDTHFHRRVQNLIRKWQETSSIAMARGLHCEGKSQVACEMDHFPLTALSEDRFADSLNEFWVENSMTTYLPCVLYFIGYTWWIFNIYLWTNFKFLKFFIYLKTYLLSGADRGSLQDCLFCSRTVSVSVF